MSGSSTAEAADVASGIRHERRFFKTDSGRHSQEGALLVSMKPGPLLLSSPSLNMRLPEGWPRFDEVNRSMSSQQGGNNKRSVWSPLRSLHSVQTGKSPTSGHVAHRRSLPTFEENSSNADGSGEEIFTSSQLVRRLGPPLHFLPQDIDPSELELFRTDYQAFRSGNATGAIGEIGWIAEEPLDESRHRSAKHRVASDTDASQNEFDDDSAVYYSEPERDTHASRSQITTFSEPRRSPTLGPQSAIGAQVPTGFTLNTLPAQEVAPCRLLPPPSTSPPPPPPSSPLPTLSTPPTDGCAAGRSCATSSRLHFSAWFGDELGSRPDEAQLQRLPRNQLGEIAEVPWRIEKLLGFGFLMCLDVLLHELTFTPLQVVRASLRLLRGKCISVTEQCDILRFSLLVLNVCIVLITVDVSYVYHYIRGESFLKLYVIFNMLEMFERWLRSLGLDLFDSVMSSVRRPWWELLLWEAGALLYCYLHSAMHLIRVLLINVAINTSSSAVLLIIVTNNFGEIKSTVFKRYEKKGLFVIVASDIVERFYLLFDLLFVLARISVSPHRSMSRPWDIAGHLCLIVGVELATDWMKFCLIIKLSAMKAESLKIYKEVLVADILLCRAARLPGVDGRSAVVTCPSKDVAPPPIRDMAFRGVLSFSHVPARRIGLCGVPLSTLVVVHFAMLAHSPCGAVLPYPRATAAGLLFSVFIVGLLAKVLLSALLFGCATRRRALSKDGAKLFTEIRAL